MRHYLGLIVLIYVLSDINALSEKFVEEFMEKITEIGGQCVEETHPSDDEISRIISRQMPTTHEGYCLILCVNKAMKIQREDGSVDLESAIEGLNTLKADDPEIYEQMKEIFTKCASSVTQDADPCLTSKNLGMCFETETKKKGLDKVFGG